MASDWIVGNRYLNTKEKQNNAEMFYESMLLRGSYSINAICGMLGNIDLESTINPQLWEGMIPDRWDRGYGLVQWTPAQKLLDWAGQFYDQGWKQCDRIQYERVNDLQWIETTEYPLSFDDFCDSNASPEYLSDAFLINYERPKVPNYEPRRKSAMYWWEYFHGVIPPEPVIQNKMSILFWGRQL